MSFYVASPSWKFIQRVKKLLKGVSEDMLKEFDSKIIVHFIDFERDYLPDLRVGENSSRELYGNFGYASSRDFYLNEGQMQQIKECDVTDEMICAALGMVPAPKQSVLAWGFKNKKTGKLVPVAMRTRKTARWSQIKGLEEVVRVRITEA